MNTISSIMRRGALLMVALLVACQGPWSYWPDETQPYLGIFTYAHVISDRPISEVCFTKMLKLTETNVDAFAFYDSASVRITGPFSGSSVTLQLTPRNDNPNCFEGPADQIAQVGGRYTLEATFRWDSSGTMVLSQFRSQTYIPENFSVETALAPAPALQENAFADPRVLDALISAYGDTIITLMSDTASAIVFYQQNAQGISQILRNILSPYQRGDTLYYMAPPNDLLSHFFVPRYDDQVGGVLITQYFDTTNTAFGESTFDSFFGMKADTLDKAMVGNRHRLSFLRNEDVGSVGNAMDSLGVTNGWFVIGRNDFLFYATTMEYADYLYTAIQSVDDSRILPKYNIDGGAGIFAGMMVDTFTVYAKAQPGAKSYPYMRARTLFCKAEGWDGKECRSHMPSFCAENGYRDHECWPMAVKTALDSGLAWNALLADTVPSDSFPAVRYGGEKKWCIANGFPDSLASATCKAEYSLAMASDTVNQSMRDLWNWCSDRNWPLDLHPQCGNALVSRVRLEKRTSSVLEREITRWCAAHPQDPQCLLR